MFANDAFYCKALARRGVRTVRTLGILPVPCHSEFIDRNSQQCYIPSDHHNHSFNPPTENPAIFSSFDTSQTSTHVSFNVLP